MRIVVLDGFPADQGELSWDGLRAFGDLEVYDRTRPDELLARAAGADVLLTNKVVLDRATLAQLPALRYVGVVATGTNVVDVAACRERGIAVTNVPGYSTHSVAQLVFAFILHFTHGVAAHDARVKRGDWARGPDFMFCAQPLTELAGRTLTVIGMGAIGRTVSDIAHAFGMTVIAAAVPGSASPGRMPLAEALPQSDYVSLHCPLTADTTHLVNALFLSQIRHDAVLVNTGRGPLVDEKALVDALRDGKLFGVALDVMDREPPPAAHPLLDPTAPWAHRVLVTPHIGWATRAARERLVSIAVDNVAAYVRDGRHHRVD
jgi:glycerate dehydrogenase